MSGANETDEYSTGGLSAAHNMGVSTVRGESRRASADFLTESKSSTEYLFAQVHPPLVGGIVSAFTGAEERHDHPNDE